MAEIDDCLMVKVVEARNIMTPSFGIPQAYAKVQVSRIPAYSLQTKLFRHEWLRMVCLQIGSGASESTEAADPGNNPVWEATTMVFTGM